MTDLRTAAQQALEYMKSVGKMDMYPEDWAIVERLEAALAEPVQEPVGEVVAIDFSEESGPEAIVTLHQDVELGTMLYTAPPQRKPLSNVDLAKIWDDALDQLDPRDQLRFVARAIERAHGIT